MYFNMDWQINIGKYQLALLAGCTIHKSVELLADTCVIELPAASENQALRIEEQLKRGDKVTVQLGYDGQLNKEFEGYLLNIATDDGTLIINCEDKLFLFRKQVKDKEFKNSSVKAIAQYLIDEIGIDIDLNCSLPLSYEKFVISKATAYDVLKKLQDETKGNIYIVNDALQIHHPYSEKTGDVKYSFQENIEECNLKYVRKEDKRIEIVINKTSKDGKKKEFRYGTSGGQIVPLDGNGLDDESCLEKAKNEYANRWFDGYEGDITTWLIPNVEPAFTATLPDEDYEYKDGKYYVSAVTTTFNESGAERKVQLGIKLA